MFKINHPDGKNSLSGILNTETRSAQRGTEFFLMFLCDLCAYCGFFKNLSHHIDTVGHNRENHNSSRANTTSFFNFYIVGLSKLVRLADRRITSFVLNSYIDELSNYRIVEFSMQSFL